MQTCWKEKWESELSQNVQTRIIDHLHIHSQQHLPEQGLQPSLEHNPCSQALNLGSGFIADVAHHLALCLVAVVPRRLAAHITAEDDHGARRARNWEVRAPAAVEAAFLPLIRHQRYAVGRLVHQNLS